MEALTRRYTFKLYPDPRQDMELCVQARMVASLWNAMLELEEQHYRRTRGANAVKHADGKSWLSEYDLGYQITDLLAQMEEWRALSTWTPRRVAKALACAFQSFFRRAKEGKGKRAGYPKYRSVRRGDWIPHRFASGCKLEHVSGSVWRLRLKGISGEITARGKLPAEPLKWADADIRLDSAGTWWLSVCVEMPSRLNAGQMSRRIVLDGIDRFASLDGRAVLAHEIGVEENSRVEELAQRMSRETRGSPEYLNLRRAKARLQAKAKRRRKERMHEWTTGIVRSAKEIELVRPAAVQDATRSGRGDESSWGAAVQSKAMFNRAVLSQAPADAVAMLRYKAKEAGVVLHEIESEHLDIGNMLVKLAKAARLVRRRIKQRAKEVTI